MTEKYEEFAWLVAEGSLFECSDDPEHEIFFCAFCYEPVDGLGHSENCPMYKAREALGDKWFEREKQIEEEIKEEERKELEYLGEQFSTCFFCGKKVMNKLMKIHHKEDRECVRIQETKRK